MASLAIRCKQGHTQMAELRGLLKDEQENVNVFQFLSKLGQWLRRKRPAKAAASTTRPVYGGTVTAYEYWRTLPYSQRGNMLAISALEWQRRGIKRVLTENGPDAVSGPGEVLQFLAALAPGEVRPVITPSVMTLENIKAIWAADTNHQIIAFSLSDEPKNAAEVQTVIAPLAKQLTALGIPVTVTLNPPSFATFFNNIGDALPCFKMLLMDCYPISPLSGPETWWAYYMGQVGHFKGKCEPLGIARWMIFQAYTDNTKTNPLTLPTPTQIRDQITIAVASGCEAVLAFGPAPNAPFTDDATWVAISQEFNRF